MIDDMHGYKIETSLSYREHGTKTLLKTPTDN